MYEPSWPSQGINYLEGGGLFYAKSDGSSIVEAVYPMMTPNGVGLSPDGNTLYAAETQTGRVWAFDIEAPGVIRKQPFPSPNGGRMLAGMSTFRLFDSLAVDSGGNVCVASLFEGGITVVSPQGGVVDFVPMPDLYTTNLCFGGPDLKTAYVTLSVSGKLVAIDWPRAGTPLHWLDHVMDRLDIILLMSVNPGFGGQSFIDSALPKLREVRRRIDAHVAAGGQPIWLEVDGGVKVDNIAAIAAAGADTFVAGSAVFGAPDADGGYRGIMSRLRGAAADRS